MRFLMTYIAANPSLPTPEKSAAIAKFAQDQMQKGILIDTGGILPELSKVKLANGKFTVTDGPFPETKELIVGYAIVEVTSRQHAYDVAREFMELAGDGEGDIRQLARPGDEPPRSHH